MQSSIKLGRIAGIDIGIHYTWLLAFVLIAWSLASALPGRYPGWSPGSYWIVGIAAALLLFASVLVHELCHSFVARARGLGVHSITLFMFGGVSNITGEARRPSDEFAIAAIGPVSSLVLGLLFCASSGVGNWRDCLPLVGDFAPRGLSQVQFVVHYLGLVNLSLGLFNLLPGFPLDGGRVFRSIVWAITGSLRQATNISTMVGQLVGWGLIAWGVWTVLFLGDLFGGLWIGFIGWFLNNAAESTRAQSQASAMFRGVRVRDVMNRSPMTVSPSTPVQDLVYDFALRQGARGLPVERDGQLVGIVTLTDVREKPREEWASLTVGDIMTPAPLYTTSPGQGVDAALQLMAAHDINQLPVVEDGRLVGMLSRANVVRYLQVLEELNLRSSGARAGSRT
jgi:Zn-dependent protease/CBS domain-containing protein